MNVFRQCQLVYNSEHALPSTHRGYYLAQPSLLGSFKYGLNAGTHP